MTKFKKRFIKIGILALMPILALVLCLQNTYAYTLDSDGNLQSDNLWTLNSSYSITSDGYLLNGNELLLDIGTYTFSFNFSGNSANCDFRLYTTYEDQSEFSRVFDIVNGLNSLTFTLNSNTTKILWYSNAVGTYTNLMLNTGNTALPYEPLGTWYNQNDYNEYKNGYEDYRNQLETINSGMLNYLDYMQFSINGEDVEINGITEFTYQDLINNNLLYNESTISFTAFDNSTTNPNINPVHCDIYFNELPSQLIALLFRGNGFGFNVNIYGNSNIYNQYVNDENNTIIGVDNSNIVSINQISFIANGDTLNSISFSDYNSIYYENGYQNGYHYGFENGEIEGNRKGYQNGYNVGYNEGYNEGVEQDLETTGVKTLFNSILSYPVNMIKSVFNFEFMGVNIASVIMFIVSIGIVIFVIRKFKE